MKKQPPLKILDLFSGIGGFSLGLERAGMKTTAFCEIEPHCQRVLAKNWPTIPVHENIKDIDCEKFKGSIDLVCGGFPCQDISIAGKNAGIGGEKSGLWTEFKRVINEVRPKYAIIENVAALLGRGLNVVLKDLAEIGYDATWTTLDAKYFGTPNRRRRVYIFAVRDGIPADCDPLKFTERNSPECRESMELVEKGFKWNFEAGEGIKKPFAFFTRQRSDLFQPLGVSSTLAKRDYKSYTDIIVTGDGVRRVTPDERLLLQGFPRDWMDNCRLTNAQKFTCNGMSTNAVEWIGRRVAEFDNV